MVCAHVAAKKIRSICEALCQNISAYCNFRFCNAFWDDALEARKLAMVNCEQMRTHYIES